LTSVGDRSMGAFLLRIGSSSGALDFFAARTMRGSKARGSKARGSKARDSKAGGNCFSSSCATNGNSLSTIGARVRIRTVITSVGAGNDESCTISSPSCSTSIPILPSIETNISAVVGVPRLGFASIISPVSVLIHPIAFDVRYTYFER
jgi:hypothetical protein